MSRRVRLVGRFMLRESWEVRAATFDTDVSILLIFIIGVCERRDVVGIWLFFSRVRYLLDDDTARG